MATSAAPLFSFTAPAIDAAAYDRQKGQRPGKRGQSSLTLNRRPVARAVVKRGGHVSGRVAGGAKPRNPEEKKRRHPSQPPSLSLTRRVARRRTRQEVDIVLGVKLGQFRAGGLARALGGEKEEGSASRDFFTTPFSRPPPPPTHKHVHAAVQSISQDEVVRHGDAVRLHGVVGAIISAAPLA